MTTDSAEADDTLAKVKKQVEDFLRQTSAARSMSEKCRDYKDHKQWTEAEVAKLTARGQAPIVVNRIKPKVDGLLGLLAVRVTDPKAFPRTQKHEKSADAVTDALRSVTDENHFEDCRQAVAENVFVEGYGGAIVKVRSGEDEGDVKIEIEEIPWDRIFFDPHSVKKDFSDARYKGLVIWMGKDEAQEKFPDVDFDAIVAASGGDMEMRDRISWVDDKNDRIRIAQHFYIQGGVWMMCFHAGDAFIVDPVESPYLDDAGKPCCPIELVTAYVDREGNRYGEVLGFIDQQDEMNHRRSKALHLQSTRQTAGRNGAIKDVKAMKNELAKPDGHVAYNGEKGDFEVLQTGDMAKGQLELYQDAKAELDAVSFNAQLAGERQSGDLSGVAINRLQQAGTMELNGLFSTLNGWEKRIYRQIWGRIRQFWTSEKWVRVTDEIDTLRWVGLNTKITVQQFLEEKVNDKATHEWERKRYAAAYTALMQANSPELEQVIEIKNPVAELAVDIILEQSFDVVNVQQEQFEMLAKFAVPGSGVDIIDLIRLSQIRGKEEVIASIEKSREQAAQAQGGMQQMQLRGMQAEIQETSSRAALNEQSAQQKQIENALLVSRPTDVNPQVSV